jgi:hypothetical protein
VAGPSISRSRRTPGPALRLSRDGGRGDRLRLPAGRSRIGPSSDDCRYALGWRRLVDAHLSRRCGLRLEIRLPGRSVIRQPDLLARLLALLNGGVALASAAVPLLYGGIALTHDPGALRFCIVALTRRPIALLERRVAFARHDPALTCEAVVPFEPLVALARRASASAGSRISFARPTRAELCGGLPSPGGFLGFRACGVTLGEHPIALQARRVTLVTSLVAFAESLRALGACPVALVRKLRRLRGCRSLPIGLRAKVGELLANLSLDLVPLLGGGRLGRGACI